MRILVIAALLVVAAIGGCDGDNGDKATPESGWTPQSGWSDFECMAAAEVLHDLEQPCFFEQPGACEAAADLQEEIWANCR